MLDRAYERLRLSARACDRVVKVAQTIADLEGAETITAAHLRESLNYREMDGRAVAERRRRDPVRCACGWGRWHRGVRGSSAVWYASTGRPPRC